MDLRDSSLYRRTRFGHLLLGNSLASSHWVVSSLTLSASTPSEFSFTSCYVCSGIHLLLKEFICGDFAHECVVIPRILPQSLGQMLQGIQRTP